MADTFNCPNCGAPLDYKGSDPIIRCPYCNGSVVVPDNLRAKPAFSSQQNNYTLSGGGNLNNLVNQARRFKEVKDLARAGNREEAVRIYCEITGSSPEEAQTAVEALANNRPITLTGLNMDGLISSRPPIVISGPALNIKPVDEKTSHKVARSVGCGIGCFVIGIVLFFLVTTVIPIVGGLTGVAVGIKPDLVLTAIPFISNMPGIAGYGTRDLSFGGEGTGPGLFSDVRAIGVNPTSGDIYAADYEGGRVQKFDPQGKFITQWILEGKNNYISSLAVDRQGNVFIVASGKLLQFDKDGNALGQIKAGSIDSFESITLGADGSIYSVNNEEVLHFKANGQVLSHITDAFSANSGEYEMDSKIAVDGQGNIYLLGGFNNAIFKFGADGKFVNRFGSDGDQPGQFTAPEAIAINGKGQVFVSDFKGIQVFSNDGRYINVINTDFAYGLTFDDQGRLYTTTNQKKVERHIIPQ